SGRRSPRRRRSCRTPSGRRSRGPSLNGFASIPQTGAQRSEGVVLDTRGPQIALGAAVPLVEPDEHLGHGLGGPGGDAAPPVALLVRRGLGKPLLDARGEVPLAEAVVVG